MALTAAGWVVPAFVQESVTRGTSLFLNTQEETASQAHYMERAEAAVNEVAYIVDRTAKLPMTDVPMLRRVINLKLGYKEALDLLKKHKKQQALLLQAQPDIAQAVTPLSSTQAWLTAAITPFVSSLIGWSNDDLRLTRGEVGRFEWLAESARNILKQVESACLLRTQRMPFDGPLVSLLFQWKPLAYEAVEGSQERRFYMRALCLGERGVEAHLEYTYTDHARVEKNFSLVLFLRLSESTDVVGIAIRCLKSLESQFKLVLERAKREFTLLASSPDIIFHPCAPLACSEEYRLLTSHFRPDPVCCTTSCHEPCGNDVASSDLSQVFPEEVILLQIECNISVPEYSLPPSRPSSSHEAGRNIMGNQPQPLPLTARFAPHCMSRAKVHDDPRNHEFQILGEDGFSKFIKFNIEKAAKNAIVDLFRPEFVLMSWCSYLSMNGHLLVEERQTWLQETYEKYEKDLLTGVINEGKRLTDYEVNWYSKHGAAFIHVDKDFPLASLKQWCLLLGST